MLQQVAYAVADGVSDDGEGEWRDPYDGEPYSAEGKADDRGGSPDCP